MAGYKDIQHNVGSDHGRIWCSYFTRLTTSRGEVCRVDMASLKPGMLYTRSSIPYTYTTFLQTCYRKAQRFYCVYVPVTCVSSSDTIHACQPLLKLRRELIRKPFPILLTHLVFETMEDLKQTPVPVQMGNIKYVSLRKLQYTTT